MPSKSNILLWLKKLDQHPQKLTEFLQTKKHAKLGWYAEHLMEYFLTSYSDFKLWGSNIQLFDGNVTTGEVDFIVENLQKGKLIQIELATKFYLSYTGNVEQKSLFIGPNARDNFERKYLHLINNQLLSKTPTEIKNITNGRKIDYTVPWVKGVLFYPINQRKRPSHESWIAPNHLYGWYCHYSDLLESNTQTLTVYKKMDWLGIHAGDSVHRNEFKPYFKRLFEEGNRAIMVINDKGQRGFIMDDLWPTTA